MAFKGMDVEEVRRTGQELKRVAQSFRDEMNTLNNHVVNTPWIGPDADRFKTDWWPKHKGVIENMIVELDGLGQSAMNNAQEQEDVSS